MRLTAFTQIINIWFGFKFILLFFCLCYNFFRLNYLKISPIRYMEDLKGKKANDDQ
jgi:hypothetical protein